MISFAPYALFTVLALSSTTASAGGTAYDWFAMDSANLWIFDRVDSKTDHSIDEILVGKSEYYGGGWYHSQVQGLFTGDLPLFDHVRRAEMWTYDDDYYYRVFDFDARVGDTWYFRLSPCNAYDVERTATHDVSGPTGEYTNGDLARFGFYGHPDPNVRCMVPATRYAHFAHGIGPIRLEGFDSQADLLFARIDGEVVAAGPGETRIDEKGGLRYTMTLVDDEIVQPEPNMCITQPCITAPATLRVALVVENIGNTVITKTFNDGQAYEFNLFDAKGNRVRSWSDGRFFTQALWSYALQPGEHKTYGVVEIPLSHHETDALLDGEFQLDGFELGNIGVPKLSTHIDVLSPS